MALLRRADVPVPGRTRIEVPVPALGGSVYVASLSTIGEQLSLLDAVRDNRGEGLPRLFAASVLDADGESLWTAEQWSTWVAGHMGPAMALEAAVLRAWGMGRDAAEDAAKN